MNITENNKLIAKFMGYYKSEYCYESDELIIDAVTWDGDVKYHTSWNWLMDVVEKIESLGYYVNKVNDDIYIVGDLDNIIATNPTNEGGINAYYQAVVQFIEWYNQNKSK